MKKDREQLEVILNDIIIKNNTNKKIEKSLKDKLKEHNLNMGEFQSIWNKKEHIDSADEVLLYLMTKYLHELLQIEEINPEVFFTETEIADGDNYKREIISDIVDYPITFNNVIKVTDDQYITTLDIKKIKQLFESNIIVYNYETQRNPKYKQNKDGDLIKLPNVKTKAVEEISESMLNKTYLPNTITLNVFKNDNEIIVFDKKSRTLTIDNATINIIDGYHRMMGSISAIGKNPNLDATMEVRITNWDVHKARMFIKQENIRNKISTNYLDSVINVTKWGNKVVTKLNEGQGDLQGKIADDVILINKNKAFTMNNIMSDTIDTLWELKTNMDVSKLSNYLIEFFNYVIGLNVVDFVDDLNLSKKNSVITYPLMFVGYLSVAKQWQDDNNWQLKLEEFLNKVDFSVSNPTWDKLGIINTSNGRPVTLFNQAKLNHIIKYFSDMVK